MEEEIDEKKVKKNLDKCMTEFKDAETLARVKLGFDDIANDIKLEARIVDENVRVAVAGMKLKEADDIKESDHEKAVSLAMEAVDWLKDTMLAIQKAGTLDTTVVTNILGDLVWESLGLANIRFGGKEMYGIKPYEAAPRETYMNEQQQDHFRNILMSWKHNLMEEVDRTVHHMQDDAANFPDPNDRATQESEFSMELRARDRERKLIKKIEESMQNLENEDYGYCEACGVEIGVKRLEARPTATLCIDCKILDEIKEKQMG